MGWGWGRTRLGLGLVVRARATLAPRPSRDEPTGCRLRSAALPCARNGLVCSSPSLRGIA